MPFVGNVSRVPSTLPLSSLADAWRQGLRPQIRRITFALALGAMLLASLLAREGTVRARTASAVSIVLAIVLAALALYATSRAMRGLSPVLRRLVAPVDPLGAARALRALSLLQTAPGTSPELALLHVTRVVDALPTDKVRERLRKRAGRLSFTALCLIAAVCAFAITNAWSLFEGTNVLLAQRGLAPFTMEWIEAPELRARPPEYLHDEERRLLPSLAQQVPYGTVLTLRATPIHLGRRLLITDGTSEVAFVDDGAGQVVARWPVQGTVSLRVAARFGEVLIEQEPAIDVASIADDPPRVIVQGAPRQARITEEPEIPIRYEATDDHGLREVHLVLRSGTREERRVLSRPGGETRTDRGGYVLQARDAFLQKSHAPVEVTVEAKDNDPLTGPKWGASEVITVLPPDLGEPEALRLEALRTLRNAMVDALARALSRQLPSDPPGRAALVAEELQDIDTLGQDLTRTASKVVAGIRLPGRLHATLRGPLEKARAAVVAQRKPLVPRESAVQAVERLVLVTDAVIRGLGFKDSQTVARLLAEIADDLALGASQMQRPTELSRGEARLDASATVLTGGARSLGRLGTLGRELSHIIAIDLARVARAREARDFMHAELAARDLAARLRQPDPSFAASGHSGRGGARPEEGAARQAMSHPTPTTCSKRFKKPPATSISLPATMPTRWPRSTARWAGDAPKKTARRSSRKPRNTPTPFAKRSAGSRAWAPGVTPGPARGRPPVSTPNRWPKRSKVEIPPMP